MFRHKSSLVKIIFFLQWSLQIVDVESVNFADVFKQIREHEFEAHRTIIMHDDNSLENMVEEEIFQTAIRISPSRTINFIQQDPIELKREITSKNYHKTTLFVVILQNTAETIEKFLLFMKQVSGKYAYPKCLMIVPLNKSLGESSNSRETLLRSAWSRNIFHLTILDIEQEGNLPRGKINIPRKKMIVHRFNNFTGVYTKMKYNKGDVLFPNKLKNLNGYEIRAFDDKSLGDGNDNQARLETISEVMNFSVVKINPDCDSSEVVFFCNYYALINCLRNHTCNVALNVYVAMGSDDESDNRALVVAPDFHSQLLPKQKITRYLFEKSIYLAIFSCLLIIFLWSLFRFLKFDRNFWKFLHLWELLLGMSVSQDVEKLRDRIALITLCFSFLVFSSSLHSILTTVELFSEYKDIIRSDDRNEKWILTATNLNGAYDIKELNYTIPLMKRTTNYTVMEDCLNDLFKNKAVCCYVEKVAAQQLILMDLKENGISTIKKLEDNFVEYLHQTVYLELNSPYVFEFERHMNRFLQAGLTYKWHNDFRIARFKTIENVTMFFKNENTFTIKPFTTLGIGFVIAIIVFIAELLF